MGIPSCSSTKLPLSFDRVIRGTLSRRQFVRRSAIAVAGITGLELLRAAPAFSQSTSAPKPIPGGFTLPDFNPVPSNPDVHVLPPAPGFEMSTITDFNGAVAGAEVQGLATGTGGFWFDTDMRVMQGTYVGEDGRLHRGTFGFI
jgi:hypothetical protein